MRKRDRVGEEPLYTNGTAKANGRGCGQVSKVMLAAQAQTQIRLEHGEISSLGSTELTHHMFCALKEHFLFLQFFLFSLSFSVLRGDESYFYIHHHLYDDTPQGSSVLVPS